MFLSFIPACSHWWYGETEIRKRYQMEPYQGIDYLNVYSSLAPKTRQDVLGQKSTTFLPVLIPIQNFHSTVDVFMMTAQRVHLSIWIAVLHMNYCILYTTQSKTWKETQGSRGMVCVVVVPMLWDFFRRKAHFDDLSATCENGRFSFKQAFITSIMLWLFFGLIPLSAAALSVASRGGKVK